MKKVFIALFVLLFTNCQAQNFIDSVLSITEKYISEQSNFYDTTIEGTHRYKNFKDNTDYWNPNDIYITIDNLSVASGWGSSRFVFYKGVLDSAILYFELAPSKYYDKRKGSSTITTMTLTDTLFSRLYSYFKDSPVVALRWSNDKYELTYCKECPSITFENKQVTAMLHKVIPSKNMYEPVAVDKNGKGNGLFIPDIASCSTLLRQGASIKTLESKLPSFEVYGVLNASYTYVFDYKGTKVKVWAITKPNSQLIESLNVTFVNKAGFNVVDIQPQLEKYGYRYNMKDTYNSQSSGIFGCKDCDYYECSTGQYVALHSTGDFSIHNK